MMDARRLGFASMGLGVVGLVLLAPLIVHAITSAIAGAGRLAAWQVVASALGAFLAILGGFEMRRVGRWAALVLAGGLAPLVVLAPLAWAAYATVGLVAALGFVLPHFWAFGLVAVGVLALRDVRIRARERPAHWHAP